ncbi:hypothetical protein D3C84_816160 [compost metagenome]
MLTTKDYARASKALGCSQEAIKAVTQVESRGDGFLPSGEPVILFERHIMNRRLRAKGIIVRDQLDVVNTAPGGYKGGAAEHQRLAKAVLIDRDAALESCSWGMFQIMGFHWKSLGYKSLQAFINDAYKSEAAHLNMFVKFIIANPRIHKALKELNWDAFARGYNGPMYKRNRYDTKLAAAYIKALSE